MNQHVPVLRLTPVDKVVLRGVEYRVRKWLPDGYVLSRVDDPRIVEEVTHEQLQALSARPDFGFTRGAFDVTALTARLSTEVDFVSDLPPSEQQVVLWRHFFCLGFLKMEESGRASRSDASMKRAIAEIQSRLVELETEQARERRADGTTAAPRAGQAINTRRPPSPRSLRTWVKTLEEHGLRPASLRNGYRKCGDRLTERFPVEVRRMLHQSALLYASETRPSATDLHKRLLADIDALNQEREVAGMPALPKPSYDRLLIEIRTLPAFEVYAGRYGLGAAMRKFAITGTGMDVERPLQRVELDEWRINLMTIIEDAGVLERLTPEQQEEVRKRRYWACVAIDVRTRVILGMRIAPTVSSDLAMETLEMVVTPKRAYAAGADAVEAWDQHGSPETVAHDQGRTFMSSAFRRAIIDLGCSPDAPPAGMPWLRGTIERFFRTIDQQALAPFTGRSFANIVEKGDYDPVGRASLTIDELCRALVRWVVDVYHNSPHAGLGGETPANAWVRLTARYGIIPPPDRHVRRAIFGIDLQRVMSSKGVQVLGLAFNALELQEHRRRHGDAAVDVKVDPADLGHVSVRLGDRGWVAVPCMRSGLDDVPISIWQAAAADLRRRFAVEARLNDVVVGAAIRDAWEMARLAQARAGILSTRPSDVEIDRVERGLGLGFHSPDQAGSSSESIGSRTDLMANAIPTGKSASAPTPASRPSRTIKPRN